MDLTLFIALTLTLPVLRGADAISRSRAPVRPPAAQYELLQASVSGESADEVFGADSFGHHDGSLAAVADALYRLRRRFLPAHFHRANPERANRSAPGAPGGAHKDFLLHRAAPDRADREDERGWEEIVAFIVGFLVVLALAICLFFACKKRAENDEKREQARLEYEERERKGEEIRKMVIDAQAKEDAERLAKRAAQKAEQMRLEEEERMQREQERATLAAEEKLKRAKKIARKALERHAKKVEQARLAREAEAAREAADKCAKCGDPIRDQYVTVDGNLYHEKCFTCESCCKPIVGNEFVLTIDGPLCRDCDEMKAAKCFTCGERIKGQMKKVDGQTYHEACCVCTRCGVQITDSYFPSDTGIICDACDEADYVASLPVCVICKKTIESNHPVIDGKPMHKACFQCAKCFAMIKGPYYKLGEAEGRYECEECHESSS